ncbi:MAG: YIP1 family protein [Candidatus Desulfofervidus auxilii]|nr:YIP1 family protein [Candidatus Desulfofervidus auxilii]
MLENMENFTQRIFRAIQLEVALYEEVEADEGALPQAMFVVVLSSLASGVGTTEQSIIGIFWGTIIALISWFIWAYLIYFIGTKWLPELQTQSSPREMLRVLGFASAPGIFRILGVISSLKEIVFFITAIWMIMAMIIAVRQALDYKSTLRAAIVCLIAWLIQAIIFILLLIFVVKGQII